MENQCSDDNEHVDSSISDHITKQVHFEIVNENEEALNETDDRQSAPNDLTCTTANMKTMEKVPHIDHYRNMMSVVKAVSSRPTLQQLRDGRNVSAESPHDEDQKSLRKCSGLEAFISTKRFKPQQKLGWIKGVLIRCILCIFGVILYLRLSWITGQAGVRGAYFLLSRSLGPEFGGSIGLLFSFANAVAVAMYVVGFAESVVDVMKKHDTYIVDGSLNDIRIISLATAVVILAIVIVGVLFETKAQMILLAILSISVLNYLIGTTLPKSEDMQAKGFTGYSWETFMKNLLPEFRGETFFSLFSIYFPAATGVMAGANISGDLKNAHNAIPKGTLLAILITSSVYCVCVLATGFTCLKDASGVLDDLKLGTLSNCAASENCTYGLLNYFQVMEMQSAFSPLITAGVFAASLSSALSSMALSNDNLFPYIRYFGRGYGRNNEPRPAYILTFLIACCVIAIGDLNIIAPIISNFFLASYALINYACFDASYSQSLGFRPAFKYYNMWLSLCGALLCLGVMIVINWWATLVTVAVILILYIYLLRRKPIFINFVFVMDTFFDLYITWNTIIFDKLDCIFVWKRKKCITVKFLHYPSDVQAIPKTRFYHIVVQFCATANPKCFNGFFRNWMLNYFDSFTPMPNVNWGSSGQAHALRNALNAMHRLDNTEEHVKNYRPQILVLTGNLSECNHLLNFATSITKDSCLLISAEVIVSDNPDSLISTVSAEEAKCTAWLAKNKYRAFFHAVSSASLSDGVRQLLQISGLGKLKPNILLLGFKNNWKTSKLDDIVEYVTTIGLAFDADFGVCVFRCNSENVTASENVDECKPLMDQEEQQQTNNPELKASINDCQTFTIEMDEDELKSEIETSNNAKPKKTIYQNFSKKNKTLKKYNFYLKKDLFRQKVKHATIDVYWLFDDGGLTLLLPYLLQLPKSYLEGAKLRVFTIANNKELEHQETSMATLLSKFRVGCTEVTAIPNITKKPDQKSLDDFQESILPFLGTGALSESELLAEHSRTWRHLRTREFMLSNSSDASLIVITMPIPRRRVCSDLLYMIWLDVLTRGMPPVLLVRGNQRSVLTFYT
ncbi:Solute carrier family 12 member 2 [Trichinella spiralis]|uniref:Solute carrier family 12 member 3 n=1 Tax=Trichinella spiralis TaxID=6334 RepID=A0A0V1BI31_TRISP|nr:Solute carrier family 12 member 2 [Trichinella spiralis]